MVFPAAKLYKAVPVLLCLLFICSLPAYSQAPNFDNGIRLEAGGYPVRPGGYASVPCVGDWDGDGLNDLLVGCFYRGYVFFYRNTGTNTVPVLADGVSIQADGATLSVDYG